MLHSDTRNGINCRGSSPANPPSKSGESATRSRRTRNIGVMTDGVIRCHLTDLAEETLADTPIIVISGPRQVSKSTLVEQLIAGRDVRGPSISTTPSTGPSPNVTRIPSSRSTHRRTTRSRTSETTTGERSTSSWKIAAGGRRRRSEGDLQSRRHRLSWAGVSARQTRAAIQGGNSPPHRYQVAAVRRSPVGAADLGALGSLTGSALDDTLNWAEPAFSRPARVSGPCAVARTPCARRTDRR